MGHEIQFKGKIRAYLLAPMLFTILLAAMDVWIYFLNIQAGICGTVCVGIYFVVTCIVYRRNKVLTWNELIDFATQDGTVQKQLLNEFEIPYGLMDASGKLLWINQAFSDLTGKEKRYHKSITSIFPQITKEQLEKNDENNFMSGRKKPSGLL